MITKEDYENAVKRTVDMLSKAGIVITEAEKKRIEVADMGLNNLEKVGLQILTYINTERVCAKELVLFPHQTCPEHIHISTAEYTGKEETFRCRKGKVFLYVQGAKTENIKAVIPPTKISVFHEIELCEGEQYTLFPETLHWFQAGCDGAVISEFSTKSRDETDVFTDERIKRLPEVE